MKKLALMIALSTTIATTLTSTVASQCLTQTFSLRPGLTNSGTGVANAMVAADFNKDGDLDVATGSTGPSAINIYLGDGKGGFSSPTSLSAGTSISSVTSGDLNRDGKLDLVVADFLGTSVLVYLGSGNGLFSSPLTFAAGGQVTDVALADYNSDGILDVAAVKLSSSTIAFFTGTGTGALNAFTTVSLGAGTTGGRKIRAADLNRDGEMDLVIGSRTNSVGGVTVLTGNGAGAFTAASFGMGLTIGDGMEIGDLNLDGKLDVVASESSGSSFPLAILLGNGNGGFGSPTLITRPERARDIAIGDVNYDGKPDIVLDNSLSQPIGILLGSGNGTTYTDSTLNTSQLVGAVAIADANHDGKPDLVYYGLTSSVSGFPRVGVALNSCGGLTQRPSGDFDGDGVTDSTVYRPSSGVWFTLRSSDNTVSIEQFGLNGDIPIDGDFDGDQRADLCIFRPSTGVWFFKRSSNGTTLGAQFGNPGDKPVVGDYDKDGISDIAIWRPSNGNFFVLRSSTNFSTFFAYPFGANGDIPVQGGAQ